MALKTKYQHGVSIMGLMMVLVLLGLVSVLAMKVVPTVLEHLAIKRAIASAKESGMSVREIETSFDRQAGISDITSISGKDLEIMKNGNDFEISFAYQKKIPLVGPASLILDYAGSTAKHAVK
jgi:hypothetical protein